MCSESDWKLQKDKKQNKRQQKRSPHPKKTD